MKARVYNPEGSPTTWKEFSGAQIVELHWSDGCSVQIAGHEVGGDFETRLMLRVWPKNGTEEYGGDNETFMSLRLLRGEEGWAFEDAEADNKLLASFEDALTRAENAEADSRTLRETGLTLMKEYRHRMGGDTPEIVDFETALASGFPRPVPQTKGGLCQVCNLAMVYHMCICSENDVISETPQSHCTGCGHNAHPGSKCPVDMSDHRYEPPKPHLECSGNCDNGPDCDLPQGHLPGD